jgi:hypothetical protein
VASLAVLGSIRVLQNVATNVVQTSAAFESFEIRLRALLGTQGAANAALQNFVDLSTRTPFSVQQIVSGATALGSVALQNRGLLEELTETSANIAAITGLGFEQAAANLQRVASAGIGAADLFRERGVRAIVESILSIPDLTKLPLEEQRDALVAVFGNRASAEFAGAAEALSFTLGGALSNIGDAATRASKELGDVFSPAIVAGARELLIPAFDLFTAAVKNSGDSLVSLVANGIFGFVRAIGTLIRQTGLGLTAISSLGITFENLLTFVNAIVNGIRIFGLTARTAFNGVVLSVQTVITAIAEIGNVLGLVSDDAVQNLQEVFQDRVKDSAEDVEELTEATRKQFEILGSFDLEESQFGQSLVSIGRRITDAGERARDEAARFAAERAARAGDQDEGDQSGVTRPDPRAAEEARKRLARDLRTLLAIQKRINIEEARREDPILARIARLDEEILKTQSLAVEGENVAKREEVLLRLRELRSQTQDEFSEKLQTEADLSAGLEARLGVLAGLDRERAEEIRNAVIARLAEAEGVDAAIRILRMILKETNREIEKQAPDFAGVFEGALQSGVEGVFAGAISGEGFDAIEALADFAEDLFSESFKNATEELGKALEQVFLDVSDSLSGAIGGLFGSEGLGSGFSSALGAAAGIGLGIVARELEGTTADIRNELAQSAVTSTQQVRGVVAGPTSIAVAQIGGAISDAFIETNRILEANGSLTASGNGVLRQIRDNLTALSGSPGVIATSAEDELLTSPTLG